MIDETDRPITDFPPLDFRSTEQIDEDHDARIEELRETLTGLPARPSVTR